MNPTLLQVQTAFKTLGYKWHPSLNLVGIRNSLPAANDGFNDQFFCAWLQPQIPAVKTVLEGQKWLNSWLFVGANGLALSEDGISGANYKFAAAEAARTAGSWRTRTWTITTDPGKYYLLNPLNSTGTAVVVPGQYANVWMLGYHQESKLGHTHPALVQKGSTIRVYLDNNRNALVEESATVKSGYFGINGHHASNTIVSQINDRWSAGCQVFPDHLDHAQLMQLCTNYKPQLSNYFTYSLLREREIV